MLKPLKRAKLLARCPQKQKKPSKVGFCCWGRVDPPGMLADSRQTFPLLDFTMEGEGPAAPSPYPILQSQLSAIADALAQSFALATGLAVRPGFCGRKNIGRTRVHHASRTGGLLASQKQKDPTRVGSLFLGAGGLEPPEAEAGGFTVAIISLTSASQTTQSQHI
jgi:hypothetical protein